ncbi:MAG: hypothetical protein GKR89_14645 [Candidatus Latescibacteria bacterium]|nr:hypothetical protein [Candidatus Latescibacterota bacterium]
MSQAQQSKQDPKAQQRHFPRLTVVLVLVIGAGLWYYGAPYYLLPFAERPDSALHQLLAPSAPVGRWLGIIGTLMMASILLYSLRKKIRLLNRLGNIRLWLSVHIFMGLMGPVLITFHTGFKLGGIVSIAYWSMVITMVSGIFGRYIYIQIPRDTAGERLSRGNLTKEVQGLDTELAGLLAEYPQARERIQRLAAGQGEGAAGGLKAIVALLQQDLERWGQLRGLRKILRKDTDLTHRQIRAVSGLVKRQAVLARRLAMVDTMEDVFHHWHVLHRPFVWIMFTVVALHIGVAIVFGYAV